MKHNSHLNTNVNNIMHEAEDAKYLLLLCKEKPDLIIRTEFGLGKYKFVKFNELKGNLMLEFNLLEDKHFKDTNSINSNIGSTCFLSIHQYLYVYSSANA